MTERQATLFWLVSNQVFPHDTTIGYTALEIYLRSLHKVFILTRLLFLNVLTFVYSNAEEDHRIYAQNYTYFCINDLLRNT